METKVWTYTLSIESKHPVLIQESTGQRLLIDTGSPINIGSPFQLCDELHNASNMGMLKEINALSQLNIDAVIGLQTLKKYHCLFNYNERTVQFSKNAFGIYGAEIDIQTPGDMFISFKGNLYGDEKTMVSTILDTGATTSYINESYCAYASPTETIQDFYPGIGTFDVVKFEEIHFVLGHYALGISFGVLPKDKSISLITTLLCDAVVGYDLFSQASMVELNFENNTMTINIDDI